MCASHDRNPNAGQTTREQGNTFRIALTGDLALESPLPHASWALGRVRALLRGTDLALCNLEATLTAHGWPQPKDIVRCDPALARELQWLGIGGVALGNNHAMDYGAPGLATMLDTLRSFGIPHTGAGESLAAALQPMTFTLHGCRIQVLSFCCWAYRDDIPNYSHMIRAWPDRPGVAMVDVHEIRPLNNGRGAPVLALPVDRDLRTLELAVRQARREADFVILSLHNNWGDGSVVGLGQQMVAQSAVDAGADLVWGHGPHVLQGVQIYRGKLILHSLGNFVSGFGLGEKRDYFPAVQQAAEATRHYSPVWEAAIAVLDVSPGGVQLTLHPIQIHSEGRLAALPTVARGRRNRSIARRIVALNAHLGTPSRILPSGCVRAADRHADRSCEGSRESLVPAKVPGAPVIDRRLGEPS